MLLLVFFIYRFNNLIQLLFFLYLVSISIDKGWRNFSYLVIRSIWYTLFHVSPINSIQVLFFSSFIPISIIDFCYHHTNNWFLSIMHRLVKFGFGSLLFTVALASFTISMISLFREKKDDYSLSSKIIITDFFFFFQIRLFDR